MTDINGLEFGLDTFGDLPRDDRGEATSFAQAIRATRDEAILADDIGVDAFAVGEHHRPEYAISTPETVLAGIATATENIRLGSGVTVLSSDDPVRVFQRFATVNAISNGRAEVILGRGSFTESFPLFGYDLSQYDELFSQKLERFTQLLAQQDTRVYPKVDQPPLRTWIGVGGTPESVVRAARYGLPLTLAIIGGNPRRFRPFVDLYHRALDAAKQPIQPIAAHSPGHVAATDEEARNQLWPHFQAMMTRIGRERGWPPMDRAHFDHETGPDGALCVGSPETVAAKIAATMEALKLSRFAMKYSHGTLPHEAIMTSIELFGTKVAPRVRELLA